MSDTATTEAPVEAAPAATKKQKDPAAKKAAPKAAKAEAPAPKKESKVGQVVTDSFHGIDLDSGNTTGKGAGKENWPTTWMDRKNIHAVKGWNPRTGGLGDYQHLVAAMKKEGFNSAIVARPTKDKPGHVDIIAGERRYKASGEAGLEQILVIIREDLINDDARAKAIAVSENSDDARASMTAVELGNVFSELEKTHGWKIDKIATETGYNPAKVRRCIQLVNAPDDVQKLIKAGMGQIPALELAAQSDEIRKKMKGKIDHETSTNEIKRLAKEIAKQSEEATENASVGGDGSGSDGDEGSSVGKRANRKKGAARAAAVRTWKDKKEKTGKAEEIAYLITVVPEGKDRQTGEYFEFRGAMAYALWDIGDLESPFLPDMGSENANEKKTLKLFDELVAQYDAKYRANNPEKMKGETRAGDGK